MLKYFCVFDTAEGVLDYEILLVSGSKVNGTRLGFYILALPIALIWLPALVERSSNPFSTEYLMRNQKMQGQREAGRQFGV